MTNTALNIEINSLPKALREEVADFVAFLKAKTKSKKQYYYGDVSTWKRNYVLQL